MMITEQDYKMYKQEVEELTKLIKRNDRCFYTIASETTKLEYQNKIREVLARQKEELLEIIYKWGQNKKLERGLLCKKN